MIQFDIGGDPIIMGENEKDFFNNNKSFQITVQIFLVVYTFFSSIRGILYGFSFIAFEEKIFFNVFKKVCRCCLKMDDSTTEEEEEKNDDDSLRDSMEHKSYENDEDKYSEKKTLIESEMANQDGVSEEG